MVNIYQLPTRLSKDNLVAELNNIKKLPQKQLQIDCAHVGKIDCTGLALLLELKSSGAQLDNITPVIITMAQVHNIKLS